MLKPPKGAEAEIALLRAFIQFAATDHGKTILQWFKAEKQRLQDKNDTEDDTTKLRQRQGVNQALSEILNTTEQSRTRIAKLK